MCVCACVAIVNVNLVQVSSHSEDPVFGHYLAMYQVMEARLDGSSGDSQG